MNLGFKKKTNKINLAKSLLRKSPSTPQRASEVLKAHNVVTR
jgi:hypothetical protein